jgi:hypothetical protein
VYGFVEATVAVEDAFRHLVLAVAPPVSNEPVLSLQAITSKMIGRHIAEETLGRSATFEGENEKNLAIQGQTRSVIGTRRYLSIVAGGTQ